MWNYCFVSFAAICMMGCSQESASFDYRIDVKKRYPDWTLHSTVGVPEDGMAWRGQLFMGAGAPRTISVPSNGIKLSVDIEINTDEDVLVVVYIKGLNEFAVILSRKTGGKPLVDSYHEGGSIHRYAQSLSLGDIDPIGALRGSINGRGPISGVN